MPFPAGEHVISASRRGSQAGIHSAGIHQTGIHQTGIHQTGILQTGIHQTGILQTGIHLTGIQYTGLPVIIGGRSLLWGGVEGEEGSGKGVRRLAGRRHRKRWAWDISTLADPTLTLPLLL